MSKAAHVGFGLTSPQAILYIPLSLLLSVKEPFIMGKKRSPNNAFTPVGQVLSSILDQYRSKNAGGIAHIAHVWQQTVGAPIAENAKPYAMKGMLLLVHVSSSVWLHQLQFLKKDLLDCLNRELEQDQIVDIKFKIGPV
jgi:predicted nucleic acid-binding Zn ribbon protein